MRQTRRDFLKQMSLAAAGLPVLAGRPVPGTRRRTDKKVGFAFIGLGNYAGNWLAPAIQKCQVAELRGIVAGSFDDPEHWKQTYGIPDRNVYSYENLEEMADNPDIDAVYVITPNGLHAEHTIRAARAGKHVMCEKPMAVSVAEARAMVETCREEGVKLAIGYRNRFEPNTREMIRTLRAGELGNLTLIESHFGFRMGRGNPTQWRLRRDLAGGGALMDMGIYTVQGARYVTGEEPVAVTAQEFKTDPVLFAEVDETLLFQLEFPSGAVASLGTSYNANTERLYVAGEAGQLELNPCYGYGEHRGWIQDRSGRRPLDTPMGNYISDSMDDFARCVLEDRESIVSGEEGLRDMIVIEAIYEAARTGRRIPIQMP